MVSNDEFRNETTSSMTGLSYRCKAGRDIWQKALIQIGSTKEVSDWVHWQCKSKEEEERRFDFLFPNSALYFWWSLPNIAEQTCSSIVVALIYVSYDHCKG